MKAGAKQGVAPGSFLASLLKSTVMKRPLTDEEFSANCFDFLVGGHETTTYIMAFTLYLLHLVGASFVACGGLAMD